MRTPRMLIAVLLFLATTGCAASGAKVVHGPLLGAPQGMELLFGSAVRENYLVPDIPNYAKNGYPVNSRLREALLGWSRGLAGKQGSGTTFKVSLTEVETRVDELGEDGFESPYSFSPGQGLLYTKYFAVDKSVFLRCEIGTPRFIYAEHKLDSQSTADCILVYCFLSHWIQMQ